ncbi:DUF3455 domain-containing protein [Rhodanobacter sp. MP7CTX1]|uniref:DUF3455 domain-containing protein n=1 Tax=Rhodanobacter sp. MP7CTX1 TaxID=2723084 RepID=UPI0016190140|nr:DUF3455 domain-containing protein [Rhodanobacter sp. MP7CTX1]MBB6187504.1 hypothetical protein [Rhodanobacter sp. MP7CTX1]
MIGRKVTTLLATVVLLVAGAKVARAAEAVPAALQPPAGYNVAFTAKAAGVQIYTSAADSGTALKWVFEAPLAELSGRKGVIHHYAGPSWEAADGSRVTRDTDTPVTTVPAKRASTDIPWLLVKVTADPAAGVLNKVVYVQRISTQGGVAPAKSPTRVGTKVGVPYSATYVFYTKSN